MIEINKIEYHQIDEQIEIRKNLINQMVGNLYPRILKDQIKKLKEMQRDFGNFIQKSEMKL